MAMVRVKQNRKKLRYLIPTSVHLSIMDVVKYYAKRWKTKRMIKDLTQRLQSAMYQVRNLHPISRHVALTLLSYLPLILLKILQCS